MENSLHPIMDVLDTKKSWKSFQWFYTLEEEYWVSASTNLRNVVKNKHMLSTQKMLVLYY